MLTQTHRVAVWICVESMEKEKGVSAVCFRKRKDNIKEERSSLETAAEDVELA